MGLISNGTTIFDTGAMAAGLGSSMTFIKKLTASDSANLTFHNGSSDVVFDNTYKSYLFIYTEIHPATDGANFVFQTNNVGGSGFNETMTTTCFRSYHGEDDSSGFGYKGDGDQAQGTSFQGLAFSVGNGNSENCSGYLYVYNPSSTVFATHYMGQNNTRTASNESEHDFSGGYFNTTAALDEIQFKFSSGNVGAGTISLYGIA